MMSNPWVNAWREEPDDQVLDRIVERRAISIADRGKMPHELAHLFAAAAKEVFLCDAQSRRILRQILEVGRAHASRNYPSMEEFELRVQSRSPWASLLDTAFAITGDAGVGKSALAEAAGRLMASRHVEVSGENLLGVPLRPMWSAKLREAGSIGDILEQLLSSDAHKSRDASANENLSSKQKDGKRVVSSLRARIRTRSYRDGVVALVVDELQFGSRGDASAWITALLLQLLGYGPLLFFVMNFSLAHKLCERPREDRRRLISDVIEVHPFTRVDEDWIRFLSELLSILPGAWTFDCKREAQSILRFTFGIRDNAVALLKIALIIARTADPDGKVTTAHIDQAYRSEAYATRRDDVERLIGGGASLKKATDLYSPFRKRAAAGDQSGKRPQGSGESPGPADQPAVGNAGSTVVVARDAIREHTVRVLDAMHKEQLQPAERKEVERKERIGRQGVPQVKVVPIRPRKPNSLDDVIGAAADLVSTK